jgi:hypothetical protein
MQFENDKQKLEYYRDLDKRGLVKHLEKPEDDVSDIDILDAEKYMIENVYPADMIYVVEEYLKKHPLSTWQNEFKNDEQELS